MQFHGEIKALIIHISITALLIARNAVDRSLHQLDVGQLSEKYASIYTNITNALWIQGSCFPQGMNQYSNGRIDELGYLESWAYLSFMTCPWVHTIFLDSSYFMGLCLY